MRSFSMKDMSRRRLLRASAGAALAVTMALTVPVAEASANGVVTVNRGACMSTIAPELKPYQAPGQNGVGPFTIVDGEHHTAPAFAGSAGCTR